MKIKANYIIQNPELFSIIKPPVVNANLEAYIF
jgi:hypothetical protein